MCPVESLGAPWRSGGGGGELVMKSDGEPAIAILAVRDALMKYHERNNTRFTGKRGKTKNGLIEEAVKAIREKACVFMSQI